MPRAEHHAGTLGHHALHLAREGHGRRARTSQQAGLALPLFGMVDQLVKRLGPDRVRDLLHGDAGCNIWASRSRIRTLERSRGRLTTFLHVERRTVDGNRGGAYPFLRRATTRERSCLTKNDRGRRRRPQQRASAKKVVWERWTKKRTFVRALEGTYGELKEELYNQPRVYQTSDMKWKGGPQNFGKKVINPQADRIAQSIETHIDAFAPRRLRPEARPHELAPCSSCSRARATTSTTAGASTGKRATR